MIELALILLLILIIVILKRTTENFNNQIVNRYSPSNDMIVFDINYYNMISPKNKSNWIDGNSIKYNSKLEYEKFNDNVNKFFEPTKIFFAINNNTFKVMNEKNYDANVYNIFNSKGNHEKEFKELIGDISKFNGILNVYIFPYIGYNDFINIDNNIVIPLFKKEKGKFIKNDILNSLLKNIGSIFNIKLSDKAKLNSDQIINCITNAEKIKRVYINPIPNDIQIKMNEYNYNNKLIDRYMQIVDNMYSNVKNF